MHNNVVGEVACILCAHEVSMNNGLVLQDYGEGCGRKRRVERMHVR